MLDNITNDQVVAALLVMLWIVILTRVSLFITKVRKLTPWIVALIFSTLTFLIGKCFGVFLREFPTILNIPLTIMILMGSLSILGARDNLKKGKGRISRLWM